MYENLGRAGTIKPSIQIEEHMMERNYYDNKTSKDGDR